MTVKCLAAQTARPAGNHRATPARVLAAWKPSHLQHRQCPQHWDRLRTNTWFLCADPRLALETSQKESLGQPTEDSSWTPKGLGGGGFRGAGGSCLPTVEKSEGHAEYLLYPQRWGKLSQVRCLHLVFSRNEDLK